jgi:hypothetical protein
MSGVEPASGFDEGRVRCWCCGQQRSAQQVVHLGSHPEVAVCLGCAHFLHQRARAREDEQRPSLDGRARDVLRSGRALVMKYGWQNAPVVGPVFRWLGQRLP